MESQEDFDKRNSIYIQQKTVLINKLQHLVDEQNKVLDEIAVLRRPTTPPKEFNWLPRGIQDEIQKILEGREEGECDYEIDHSKFTHVPGWTPGRVVLKSNVEWTESIEWILKDSREILDEHQSYLIKILIRLDCETKEQPETEKKRKHKHLTLDSDE